jgi:hypothetical protein
MSTASVYFSCISNKQGLIRLVVATFVVLWVSGCAYNVAYNPSYLPPAPSVTKSEGKVLIMMTAEQEQWVYSDHPTSFTGSGTTLTIPIGSITKQVALSVFEKYFQQVGAGENMQQAADYQLVVNPVVQHFEYAYNQLKNLGFAITPEVQIDLHVTVYNSGGKELLSRTYSSGEKEGSSYMISGSPDERINKMVHETLYELMMQAAQDSLKITSSP